MSNSFPSMISNEPPPLDISSEEEDSEEFRTPGLKLDLSADPSPMSTPRKSAKCESTLSSYPVYLQPMDSHSLTNGRSPDCDIDVSNSPNESPVGECEIKTSSPSAVPSDSSFDTGINRSASDSQGSDEFTDCNQHAYVLQSPQFSTSREISPELLENCILEDSSTILNVVDLERQNPDSALAKDSGDRDRELKSDCNFESLDSRKNTTSPIPASTTVSSDDQLEGISISPKEGFSQISSPIDVSVNDNNEGINNEQTATSDSILHTASCDFQIEVVEGTIPSGSGNSLNADDEFEEFQDSNTDVSVPVSIPNSLNIEEVGDDRFGDAQTNLTIEEKEDAFGDFEGQEDEFGDFGAFQTTTTPGADYEKTFVEKEVDSSNSNEMKTSYIGPIQDDDEDEFGDFSSTSATWPNAIITDVKASPADPIFSSPDTESRLDQPQQACIAADSDDFADFQNFQEPVPQASSTTLNRRISYTMTPRTSIDSLTSLESKFENLVKTVIPKIEDTSGSSETTDDSKKFKNIDKELQESNDAHWVHVQDFEESKGLVFKWPNSHCQQKLYNSLNIDSTTIVYTERWGAIEVPRFAASMVEAALLQPEVCPSSMKSNETDEFAHKSGVTSSEDTQPNTAYGRRPLSKEAQQILQQIPDLSFMRSKTLVFPQAPASKNSVL